MNNLQPVTPLDLLRQLKAELDVATRYGLVIGQPVDAIDREHISTAFVLTELLIAAQRDN